MERRGSGIAKILEAYKNDEKKPKFEIFNEIFVVTFYSRLYKRIYKNAGLNDKNVGLNDKNAGLNDENAGLKILEKIKEKHLNLRKNDIDIICLIIENDNITQKQIAEKLGKTDNVIYKNIKKLKEQNILERIGSKKCGYWKIKW